MIDRPIFVLGNVRSGTTVFYNLLAVHPDVCWFSNYSDRYWRSPVVPFVHRLLDVPVLGARIKRAIAVNRRPSFPVPWPREGDEIYHTAAGLGQARGGVETTLTDDMERTLRLIIERHLRRTGRRRFLSKQIANNRRIALLDRMFPDARYVHVIRDGRAAANSTLGVPWWRDTVVWWSGRRVCDWENEGGEPIVLAAQHWEHNVREVRARGAELGARYKEVRYEDLVTDTAGVVEDTARHCQLPVDENYLRMIPKSLPDMNRKWAEALGSEQIEKMERAIGPYLRELGYAVGEEARGSS